MRQSRITFKSGGLVLEGAIALPQDTGYVFPGAVVCHPHPLFGGDMENAVVIAICRILALHGIASLRFNFRGVGNSEGIFSNGTDEPEDVRAALNVLRKWPGISNRRVGVIGYSFGTSVVLRGLSKCKEARAFVLIAPPPSALKSSTILEDTRPSLILAGENDKIAPVACINEILKEKKAALDFQILPNADHSLSGHEADVGKLTWKFLTKSLK